MSRHQSPDPPVVQAGGWVALIDGLLGLWVSNALLTYETAGRNVIPLS